MDRFSGGPPMGAPPPGGQGQPPLTFAQYLGQRNPQLMQQIGQALGGGQGGPPPGMGMMAPSAPGGPASQFGPGSPMGGGMPPQAQQMAMQDPMYLAGQAAARMMASRGGMPPQPGGPPPMPPMGGPPGMPPR